MAKNKSTLTNPQENVENWRSVLNDLRDSNSKLYARIVHKMIIQLRRVGVAKATELQYRLDGNLTDVPMRFSDNRPRQIIEGIAGTEIGDEVFQLAFETFGGNILQENIEKWLHEDRSSFLLRTLSDRDATYHEAMEALAQYIQFSEEGLELSPFIQTGLKCDLIRRFLTDELEYINTAKEFVRIHDFYDLLQRTIALPESQGKLGGKTAGMFIAAMALTRASSESEEILPVRIPKTWYIASDTSLEFINYNNLEEIVEQKYKEIWQVRAEYDHIVQLFKSSHFPPIIVDGVRRALEDFGEVPLVVRSSSLLEDRRNSAFSGKYKSLFLANQGSFEERLAALLDAIAEVYASLFGPDPIEYRSERGLIDFHEEMGIIIQEVVGKKIGHYFLPAYAGVIFSHNEFRWSPRIKREDGLVRMVCGLGTRAVDRLGDDYPIMFAPGQPTLRVNMTPEEALRYAPNKIDLINLKLNRFETIPIKPFLRKYGSDIPYFTQIISLFKDDRLTPPSPLSTDLEQEVPIITFEGLISRSKFVERVVAMTRLLRERLMTPVDIEFASDGKSFYVLQCRAQAFSQESEPAVIPFNVPANQIMFTAKRYVSNGRVNDITHVVYVVPNAYAGLPDKASMIEVGRIIGALNKALPRRQFILIGPGRWGSRGDINLGVSVTYADISNTAMLIEVARKKGNYVPDLSFGTHFFQDLVESEIRYLPLYPDDSGIVFNESFLLDSPNVITDLLPDSKLFEDVIRVIDIPGSTGGKILEILMNGELDEAAAILTEPTGKVKQFPARRQHFPIPRQTENHWRWRMEMAERIAASIPAGQLGLQEIYLMGNVQNGTSSLDSDIDLLIVFSGTESEKSELSRWFEGWSLCLDEINYLKNGLRRGGLLDIHLIDTAEITGTLQDNIRLVAGGPAKKLVLKV